MGAPLVGRSRLRRVAMVGASEGFQRAEGTAAMSAAKASDAFALGKPASRIPSVHGSKPRRARAEATLSLMPLCSSPIVAKRKSLRLVSSWLNRAARATELPLAMKGLRACKLLFLQELQDHVAGLFR